MTEWARGCPGPCWDPTEALLPAELSVLSPPGTCVQKVHFVGAGISQRVATLWQAEPGPLGPSCITLLRLEIPISQAGPHHREDPTPTPIPGQTHSEGSCERKRPGLGKQPGSNYSLANN